MNNTYIDAIGRFVWFEEEAVFNFGKHRGKPVREIAGEYPDYLIWMPVQDFSPEVRDIVACALKGEFPDRAF